MLGTTWLSNPQAIDFPYFTNLLNIFSESFRVNNTAMLTHILYMPDWAIKEDLIE